MSRLIKSLAAAALLASGSTIVLAQTEPPAKSKTEAGAPEQGPTKQGPNDSATTGAGAGTPSTSTPATPPNPTGMSKEKQKGEANDPQQGGKKQ